MPSMRHPRLNCIFKAALVMFRLLPSTACLLVIPALTGPDIRLISSYEENRCGIELSPAGELC
jgi:hypothetical protein